MNEVLHYPIHPISLAFPAMVGAEREAMKASIQADGVMEPIDVWVSPKDEKWIVNGRTRIEMVRELVAEGHFDADLSPLPVRLIKDVSEGEMVGRVARNQMHHRSMTQAQKACMVVKIMNEERTARKARKAKYKGNLLKEAATQYGVSHAYVEEAATLHDKAPDLFERIISSEYGISDARNELAKRTGKSSKKAAAQKEEKGEASPQENGAPSKNGAASTNGTPHDKEGVAPEEKPRLVIDGNNQPVSDPALQEIFLQRGRINEMINAIHKMKREVVEIVQGSAGAHMNVQELTANFTNVTNHLRKHGPYTVCPNCSGSGKVDGDSQTASGKSRKKKCAICSGNGFLDEMRHKLHQSHLDAANGKEEKETAEASA